MNAPTMNSHAIACVAAIGENDPALVGAMIRAMENTAMAYAQIRCGVVDGLDYNDAEEALDDAHGAFYMSLRDRFHKQLAEAKAKGGTNGEA